MAKTILTFKVKIEYETKGPLSYQSMAINLEEAIEHMRQESTLTPCGISPGYAEISANWVDVETRASK